MPNAICDPYEEDYHYDYEDVEETCDCTEYEIDWEGRATCDHCHRSWWASSEEITAQERWQAEYMEAQDAAERPWDRFKAAVHFRLQKIRWWFEDLFRRVPDDGIPF